MERANKRWSTECWAAGPDIKVWDAHVGSPSLQVQFELRIVRRRTRSLSVPFQTQAMPGMNSPPYNAPEKFWKFI